MPGRDFQVSEGDWTAMIGTADELADAGHRRFPGRCRTLARAGHRCGG